jgi:hypothetical protein
MLLYELTVFINLSSFDSTAVTLVLFSPAVSLIGSSSKLVESVYHFLVLILDVETC